MKRLILLLSLLASSGFAHAQVTASDGFNRLKALEGKWTGEGPNGLELSVDYELVSGGKAVIETRRPEGEPSMVTVFHLDNETLMMTHYCSVGNQPRMQSTLISGRIIEFSEVDVTGLATDGEGHMSGLQFDFSEPDVLKQLWTWTEEGAHFPAAFSLTRVNQ